MRSSTSAACPDAVSKCKVILYETTYAASLAGWIPPVDFGESLSLRCEFILKHRAEHAEAIVISGFPQFQRTSQTAQIDVFHKYSVILFGYRSTCHMAEALALVGDMFLKDSNLIKLLVIVMRAKLHTRQPTLCPCEFCFTLTVESWIVGHVAVAVNIEVVRRVIQPKRSLFRRLNGLNVFLKLIQQRNKVFAAASTAYGSAFQCPVGFPNNTCCSGVGYARYIIALFNFCTGIAYHHLLLQMYAIRTFHQLKGVAIHPPYE